MTVICPNCQAENQLNQKFCSKCGHELPKAEVPKTDNLRSDLDRMAEKNKRKNKTGLIIGVIGLIVLLTGAYFLYQNRPSFDAVLTLAATEVNKSCPVMIDEVTRLDKVEAIPGKIFQYNYTLVGVNKADMDVNEFKKNIEPGIMESVKSNAELKLYRDNKVTMVYVYHDDKGEIIHKYSVTPDMYK